jgi:hypothetical protein
MTEAFLASVRAGVVMDPCATGLDGVRALEVALAAYRSSKRQNVPSPQRAHTHDPLSLCQSICHACATAVTPAESEQSGQRAGAFRKACRIAV